LHGRRDRLDAPREIGSHPGNGDNREAAMRTGSLTGSFLAIQVALALVAGAGGAVAAEETLKVSVPQRGVWDTGISDLGQRAGIFKKHGLVLEVLYTEGGAESQQAIIAGSMDIAVGVGVGSVLSAFSRGAPVRVIGGEMIGSPNQYWYVPANSPVRTLAEAAGKTIGFSVTGSSSHLALLELLQQSHVSAKPTATGGMPSTLTATMSGQIDVGWASAPFGLDLIDQGKIRILAKGSEITALNGRTVRWNITNLDMLAKRKDALVRYMQAYRETIDWMYGDPSALKVYAEYAKLPESQVAAVRDYVPKAAIMPDRIAGMQEIIADSVKLKFLQAPLTELQIKELVQMPAQPR
jgi:NitT/TauT family transport system substrate-binding protein